MAGSFLDNGYRGGYEFSPSEEYRIHFRGGQYTEYIFAGPGHAGHPDGLHLADRPDGAATAVVPRLPPVPLVHLHPGRGRADRRRAPRDEVPCDSLWLDIEYMDGYRVFTWDAERFPDPRDAGAPGRQGLPGDHDHRPRGEVRPGYEVFDAGLERDVFCRTEGGDIYLGQVWPGNTAFPDFVTEEARTWWGRAERRPCAVRSGRHLERHERAGDRGHPARAMRFGRGAYSHERFHNQYALLMAMGTTAGLLDAMPDQRTFVLSRAGFAGIQRYAANWMGDNLSRWDHLWVSIPMGAGFGLSGQAFVGADIGGFAGNTNPELFLRWMQYGVLTPFCRNHSGLGNVDQYAWSFGDVIGELVRTAVRLRYRLLPYLYACFLTAAETGAPVQRPLVFDHQYDGAVRDLDDEYLLGPDLLVAPVTSRDDRAPGLPAGRRLVRLAHRRAWSGASGSSPRRRRWSGSRCSLAAAR